MIKYIILITVFLILGFGSGLMVCLLIGRKMKKKPPLPVSILSGVGLSVLVLIAASAVYVSIHYSADEEALSLLSDPGDVTITETENAYFIDGAGEDTAFIFYPGAKVDPEAYLPLMCRLAGEGIDCFLIRPPLRFAILDINAAGRIIENYNYKKYMVSGHSMGGVAASSFAADHPELVDAVVLMASYPVRKISDETQVLSVYGSCDNVLSKAEYSNSRSNFPHGFKEIVISGGNHAGFGNYGEQLGDGKALITPDVQQKSATDAVLELEKTLFSS